MPNSKLTTEPCGGVEVWPFGDLAPSICQSCLPENFLRLDDETYDSEDDTPELLESALFGYSDDEEELKMQFSELLDILEEKKTLVKSGLPIQDLRNKRQEKKSFEVLQKIHILLYAEQKSRLEHADESGQSYESCRC